MANKERVPLGCLLGQPRTKVAENQLKRMSAETGISVRKIKAALKGNPAGLTYQELERLMKTLRKEE